MRIALDLIREDTPGPRWQELFHRFWPAYRRWYYAADSGQRPPRVVAEHMLRRHMPALMPVYRRLLQLAGGDVDVARFLTLYGPAPYLSGCSQAVWLGGEPVLVRNYDYSPRLWEAVLLSSCWSGRQVMAMSDCLWGALDGINEDGLAVSLAFGGSRTMGDGFGSPLLLRCILETCRSAREARQVLSRVPTHMAYNITVVDSDGDLVTAFLAPDEEPQLTEQPFATNHQSGPGWDSYIHATGSLQREQHIAAQLRAADASAEALIALFQQPPLLSDRYTAAMGTLYTAVYYPRRRQVTLIWPQGHVSRSLDSFTGERLHIDLAGTAPEQVPLNPPTPS